MTSLIWFLLGIAVLPVGFGLWWVLDTARLHFGDWYTRPVFLEGKRLAWRRSLIVGLTLELLDAKHVRAFRLPFNRVFIIRSNSRTEYDFVGKDWVVIGSDFKNAAELIGHALDQLGYELPEADSLT